MAKDVDAKPSDDNWDLVTTRIHQWEHEGDMLEGRVLEVIPFTGGKFDTEVNQYILQVGDDRVSTVLGSSTDKQVLGTVKPGAYCRIIYQGKSALDDGRQVNNFRVLVRR